MQQGFMLFELMVALCLILFCSGLGFMAYSSHNGTSFTRNAALISLLFQTASTRAHCLKKEQIIIFNPHDATIFFDNQRYELSDGYRFQVLPDTYGPPSAPHKLVTHPITFSENRARVHPDGTLQAGTLYITHGNRQYALTTPVSAFSHIRVYRYTQNVWQKYW
jgi:hypothetical protein